MVKGEAPAPLLEGRQGREEPARRSRPFGARLDRRKEAPRRRLGVGGVGLREGRLTQPAAEPEQRLEAVGPGGVESQALFDSALARGDGLQAFGQNIVEGSLHADGATLSVLPSPWK